jgi:hypothetical protein
MQGCNHIRKKPPPKAKVELGIVRSTAQAADLFATMLRSVEIEEQRAEENANGRPSTAEIPRR